MRLRAAGLRERWPWAILLLFSALLAWYLFYTARIVEALESDSAFFTEIFGEVQAGMADTSSVRQLQALFAIQQRIRSSEVPLIVTGPSGDTVVDAVNLPFEVDLNTRRGQARVLDYADELDRARPHVPDPTGNLIHYGDTPIVRSLRWIPWLQAGGLVLTVMIGVMLFQYQRRAAAERAWTAMARELAHQLGTPISSLQGWLEVLRIPAGERPGGVGEEEIADEIAEDLVRLEGISRRFELIGREPELQPVDIHEVVARLESYISARLPKLGPGVELRVEIPDELPDVLANEVLLAWALENVVKNALDALAGQGGTIAISANQTEPGWIRLRIKDTGVGVAPEIRDSLFEPGVTTKEGGWGVGLALARRIVEGVHGGKIDLLDLWEGGATFQVRLPEA